MKHFLLMTILALPSVAQSAIDTMHIDIVNTTDTALITRNHYSFTDSALVDSITLSLQQYSDTFTLWYRYYAKRNKLDTCLSVLESLLVVPAGKRTASLAEMCPSPLYHPLWFASQSQSHTLYFHDTITCPEYAFHTYFKDIVCAGTHCGTVLVRVEFHGRDGGVRPLILKATPTYVVRLSGARRTAASNAPRNSAPRADITGRKVTLPNGPTACVYIQNDRIRVHMK